MTNPHDFAAHHADRFQAQLVDLLRIPSISTSPEHAGNVQRAAQWLLEDMRRIGLEAAIFQEDGFLPLVYGEWLGGGPDAPTVLIYCHYDVQPAEMADGWTTNPFEPVVRDGKIYARGAVDSKSHVIAHLKAAESWLQTENGAPVNIKLLFEGEEESGSEHIFRFVANNPERLAADVCVISDGSNPDPNQPVLIYGLRGIITLELEVTGPARDLHSGHYGGTVHNPIQALSEILSQLHDDNGTVTVPGFYEDVRPLSSDERGALEESAPWMQSDWETVTGAPQPWGESEYRIHERIGARPTLEINGIAGGFYGDGFKTVLPRRALAKLSCRLVPDQNPDRIYDAVREHIRTLTPPTIRAELRRLEQGAPGILIQRDSPAMQATVRAYEKGWGTRPIFAREGGSVPVAAAFQQHLDCPLVMMPFGYKGGGAHGPDEYVVVDMFRRGINTAIHFYSEFAENFKAKKD